MLKRGLRARDLTSVESSGTSLADRIGWLIGRAGGLAIPLLALVVGCASPHRMTLVSNQENTVFLGKRIGGPDAARIYGEQQPDASAATDGLVPLGQGKFVKVLVSPRGIYEIVARPADYRERRMTISAPFTSRLGFTFEISDRVGAEQGSLAASEARAASTGTSGSPARSTQSYAPNYARRVAAVIGINRYRNWPALEGAVNDARRIAELLRKSGFDKVIELYDDEATREKILELLGEVMPAEVGDEDLAMIYFAGHGQTETLPNGEKRGYVIPVEGSTSGVFSSAISMETLRDLSNRIPAKHVYYVMDSCYSGLGLTRGIARVKSEPGYVRKLTMLPTVQMITAGMEGEQALERGGQGLFTHFLIRALEGEADADGDGYVTSGEIGSFVRPQVTNASRERQTPLYGTIEGSGEIVFPVR